MLRVILWNLFLFSLPFFMTLGWQLLFRKVRPNKVAMRLWVLSAVIGTALIFAGLLFFRFQTGAPPGREYVPPQVKDGVLVPGHFKDELEKQKEQ